MKSLMKRKPRRELGGSASGAELSFSSQSVSMQSSGGSIPLGLASSDDDALNDVSLSRSTPGIKTEEMLAEEDARKLEQLAAYLANSKKTTAAIVEVLETVEERVAQVEHDIMVIHKVTSRLRSTNTNVTNAVAEMDAVFFNFELESLQMVLHQGPSHHLPEYLNMMAITEERIAYFEKNSIFQSAEGVLKKLRRIKEKAVEACEKLLTETLEKCSIPIDPASLPTPMPKELKLIDETQEEKLLMLAEVLHESPVLRRDFMEFRNKFLMGTIRKGRSGVIVSGKKGAEAATVAASASQGGRLDDLMGEDDDEDQGKAFAEFSLLFLRVSEHERRLAQEIFGAEAFQTVFSGVFEGSFDLFVRFAEVTVSKKPRSVPEVERVFYLLDVYDELSGRLKPLNQVTRIGNSTYRDRVTGIVELFRSAVKQALTVFLEHVQRDNVKVGPDGNVHPLSSKTLNYLIKRMTPKRTCVEFLVDKWLDVSTVSLEVIILTICNELSLNLEEKSKRVEKKSPVLANIFLLNNYHYILHTVSNNNMLPPDLLPTFSASYETKISQEIEKYRQSWNIACEFLAESSGGLKHQIHSTDYKQIKARFSGFNKALEKLFHSQKLYSIPNKNLREELRELAKSIVVPRYEKFLQRYAEIPFTKNRSKYEQYTVETLVEILTKFFSDP